MGYHIINFEATMMKLVFSESAVNFPSIGTHFCKKKVSGSRRKTMKGVNVLTEGKAKNGRLGHSHCDGRGCSLGSILGGLYSA
mgnify:CR=1 FL=1